MGIEYYIVNKENKTFYDLGKGGCWYYLMEEGDKSYLKDLELLEMYICEDIFNIDDPSKSEKEFFSVLALDLFNFAKGANLENITVCSDNNDDCIVIKYLKYRCVGTKYKGSSKEDEQERIDFENRHFKNHKYYELDEESNKFLIEKYRLCTE